MYITLTYVCPACGYTWDESFASNYGGACRCPSCEELVLPSMQS